MKLSVVMALYRGECDEHFNAALISIWDSQILKPDEIVLVKDGPLTSSLEDVIDKWKEKLGSKLNVIALLDNHGLGAALKTGLCACRFELVARMDSDDLAAPERFQKQLNFLLENPAVDILGSFVKEMSYFGEISKVRSVPIYHNDILQCLWASPMVHPSIMMRRSRVLHAGNYDARFRRRQDYELWFRCAEKGLRFYNLPEPLLYYRFDQHTHKKQTPRLAWEQAMIGYRGSSRLGAPLLQRFACFIPFVRSLLPSRLQHSVYKILSPFDPRRRT